MLGEKILGKDASYLRRLGALCVLLCGCCALLGMVLVSVQPDFSNYVATVAALAMSLFGLVLVSLH